MIPRILRAAPAGVLLVALMASTAAAAPSEDVVRGQHLQLTSVSDDRMQGLGVGDSAAWDVGLQVLTPGEATVAVSLEVVQATADAFAVTVARCDTRWTDDACPTGAVTLTTTTAATGERERIDRVEGHEAPWYRLAVTRTGGADGATSTLRVRADGAGEDVSTGPGGTGDGAAGTGPTGTGGRGEPSGLPSTGVAPTAGLLLAAASITGGLLVSQLGRRSRRGKDL